VIIAGREPFVVCYSQRANDETHHSMEFRSNGRTACVSRAYAIGHLDDRLTFIEANDAGDDVERVTKPIEGARGLLDCSASSHDATGVKGTPPCRLSLGNWLNPMIYRNALGGA
jgi:hypothetical protein